MPSFRGQLNDHLSRSIKLSEAKPSSSTLSEKPLSGKESGTPPPTPPGHVTEEYIPLCAKDTPWKINVGTVVSILDQHTRGESVRIFETANNKGTLELTNAAIVIGCDKSKNGEDLMHVLPCHFLSDGPHDALEVMKQWADRNFIHLNTCIELDNTEILPSGTWHSTHSSKTQERQPIKYAWLLPSSKRIIPARNVFLHTSNSESEHANLHLEHYQFMNLMMQCNSYGQNLKDENEERFWDAVSAVLRINESRNEAERELARVDLLRATWKILDEWDSARFRVVVPARSGWMKWLGIGS